MVKLNLGSHGEIIPGYLNIDMDPADKTVSVVANACKLPFCDESVDEILAFHLLEHMRATNDYEPHLSNPLNKYTVLETLQEWKRVLLPGGSLYIKVPDFEKIVWLYINFPQWSRSPGPGGIFGNYTFWINSIGQHQSLFCKNDMLACLLKVGFSEIYWLDGSPQPFIDRANLEMHVRVIK